LKLVESPGSRREFFCGPEGILSHHSGVELLIQKLSGGAKKRCGVEVVDAAKKLKKLKLPREGLSPRVVIDKDVDYLTGKGGKAKQTAA
jgi:hypothetical protein